MCTNLIKNTILLLSFKAKLKIKRFFRMSRKNIQKINANVITTSHLSNVQKLFEIFGTDFSYSFYKARVKE